MNFKANKALWTSLGVGLVIGAAAIANNVTIPYSFNPHTPTSASQVNANFQALKGAIDNTYTKSEADARPANLRACYWKYRNCADAGVQCRTVCDVGDYAISGGCDGAGTTLIRESFPGPSTFDYRDAGVDHWYVGAAPADTNIPVVDTWTCSAEAGGSFNAAYVFCCPAN